MSNSGRETKSRFSRQDLEGKRVHVDAITRDGPQSFIGELQASENKRGLFLSLHVKVPRPAANSMLVLIKPLDQDEVSAIEVHPDPSIADYLIRRVVTLNTDPQPPPAP